MLRIYDEFLEDETIQSLKDRAYRLHVSALIYCSRNLTDGALSERAVKVLQVILGYQVKRWVTELLEAELWLPADDGDGFVIRNYLEFNPNAETVKKERAASRERMRKLREKRAGSPEGSPEGDGARSPEHDAERSGAVHTSPVQSFERSKGFSQSAAGDNEKPWDGIHLREVS